MSKRVATIIEIATAVISAVLVILWARTQSAWIAACVILCGCIAIYLELNRRRVSNDVSENTTVVHELLPIRGCQDPQRAGDVIFVHGLNGNPHNYWCHDDNTEDCWLTWLGEELSGVGVWSLGYENAAFKSRKFTLINRSGFFGFAMPLTDRAKNVLLRLELKGIGERSIVFIRPLPVGSVSNNCHPNGSFKATMANRSGIRARRSVSLRHRTSAPSWQSGLATSRSCWVPMSR